MATMKTVSARQANRECSDPLLRAERGEQVLIVATLKGDDHRGAQVMPVYTYTTFDDPAGTNTQANGINDSGQISGFYGNASGNHGFLYSGDHARRSISHHRYYRNIGAYASVRHQQLEPVRRNL